MFEAFSFGPFLIWTHAVFLLLAVWLGSEFFFRLARSARLSIEPFKAYAWWFLLAFLLGGRLSAILMDYRVYLRDLLRVFIVWDGGFSFLGAAIGIGVVLFWTTRDQRSTFLQWLDVLLPAASFGLVFDWLGKFAAGHAYGRPTDHWWGVTYEAMNVRYVVPVEPVQLYYAFFFLLLTFVLLIVRKHASRAGSETLIGIVLATAATFGLEYLRGDFGIPVFASRADFAVLCLLFLSLGFFAIVERRLSSQAMYVYEVVLVALLLGYIVLRGQLSLPTHELRFSQFLSVLALLAAIVYVVVHRRKYPHL